MKLYAHYFATGAQKFLIISTDMRPVGTRYPVSGVKMARKLADEQGAEHWNF